MSECGCVAQTLHWGWTEYTNICNGQFASILWGGVDWAIAAATFVALALAGVTVCLLMWRFG